MLREAVGVPDTWMLRARGGRLGAVTTDRFAVMRSTRSSRFDRWDDPAWNAAVVGSAGPMTAPRWNRLENVPGQLAE